MLIPLRICSLCLPLQINLPWTRHVQFFRVYLYYKPTIDSILFSYSVPFVVHKSLGAMNWMDAPLSQTFEYRCPLTFTFFNNRCGWLSPALQRAKTGQKKRCSGLGQSFLWRLGSQDNYWHHTIHACRETAYVVTRKSAKTTIEDYQRCVRPVDRIQCLLSDL